MHKTIPSRHGRLGIVLGVALALFAVLTIAVPAGAATTTLAVKALNVTPRKVTGTAGQATATTVNWTITDSDRTTGTVTGTVTIRLQGSTPGTYVGRDFQAPFAFNQTLNGGATFLSGTARNSSYSYTFAIPRYAAAANGTWVVTDISVQDDRGHSLDAGDAALANFLHRSVVSLVELIDSTPPTFSNLSLRLNTDPFIYQNGTAATASYSLFITDQESGFWQASITLAGPNGATLSGGVDFVAGQFGGTCGDFQTGDQDAFCTVSVTIPPGTAAGTWSVSAVTLVDNAGNTKTYPSQNAAPFVLTSDGVLNAHDFSLTQNPVNNWAGPATTALTFTATGAQHGISTVTVRGNSGFQFQCAQQVTTTPITNADGSFTVPIRVGQGETACVISAIAIVDGSGNASVYGTDYGAPDPGLTITQVPDTIAPTVRSAVLNPATISSGPANPGTVFINAIAVTPIAPVNQFATNLFDSAGNPLPGNGISGGVFEDANGRLQLFVFTNGLAAGTYTVGFTIVDEGGLQNTYGPNGLPVPGGPLTLTVTP
jgi:hypothetical protein